MHAVRMCWSGLRVGPGGHGRGRSRRGGGHRLEHRSAGHHAGRTTGTNGRRRMRRHLRCRRRRQRQPLPRPDGVRHRNGVPLRQIAKIHTVAEGDGIKRVPLRHHVAAAGDRRACHPGCRHRRGRRVAARSRFDHHRTAHGAAAGQQRRHDEQTGETNRMIHACQHTEARCRSCAPRRRSARPQPPRQQHDEQHQRAAADPFDVLVQDALGALARTGGSAAPATTRACRVRPPCTPGTARSARPRCPPPR
ncbi:hypothetical protein RLIN73S_05122 [Rhodanobacter lindaniclasticus]